MTGQHVCIVAWDESGRIKKYQPCASQAAAEAHVARVAAAWPQSFAAESPGGGTDDWRVVEGALTLDPPPPDVAALKAHVTALRDEKLAAGFDYDFGDARGVHRFGTTEADRKGWDEVKAIACSLIQAGQPETTIDIRTDTGDVTVTAAEWPAIQLAGAQMGQPIWAASWTIKDAIEAGTVTGEAEIDAHPAWPV